MGNFVTVWVLIGVVGIIGFLGLISLWLGRALRKSSGLPVGVVRFSDTGYKRLPAVLLVSDRLKLTGKPDFLIRTLHDGFVPVEEKSSLLPRLGPYWNHVVQLGVYLILVEERYGRASYGVLKYRNGSVKIEFTPVLRKQVLEVVGELKRIEKIAVDAVKRSHDSASKCRFCGFIDVCGQAVS